MPPPAAPKPPSSSASGRGDPTDAPSAGEVPPAPRLPRFTPRELGAAAVPLAPRPSRAARLTRLQVHRPLTVLLAVLAVSLVAGFAATRLGFEPGLDPLAPGARAGAPTLDARRADAPDLFVVLEPVEPARDPARRVEALRRAAEALALALEPLDVVVRAESILTEARRFLEPRAALFADLGELERLRERVEARAALGPGEAAGIEAAGIELDLARLEASLASPVRTAAHYPDGDGQAAGSPAEVVAVDLEDLGADGDLARGAEALERVRSVTGSVLASSPGIRAGYAGELPARLAARARDARDLRGVGLAGAALVAAVALLCDLRLRTAAALLLGVGAGAALAFGAARALIGRLNLATGFLFPVVIGAGLYFGVAFVARYLEARREDAALETAIRIAHEETWAPTLRAAGVAGAGYAALLATEFRGFRDFGAIGALGLLFAWLSAYASVPSVLALFERAAPLGRRGGRLEGLRASIEGGRALGGLLVALAARAPRLGAAAGVALALGGLALAAGALDAARDPGGYDLRRLEAGGAEGAEARRLAHLAASVAGHARDDGVILVAEEQDQIASLLEALRAREAREARDAGTPAAPALRGEVRALQDLVPARQTEKLEALRAIRSEVLAARRRGLVADAAWTRLEPLLPPGGLEPFGLADLPAAIARPFTEVDGTRGRIAHVAPAGGEATEEARALLLFAEAYREVPLPDGTVLRGAGPALARADAWAAAVSDLPRAVALPLAAVAVAVALAFRRGRALLLASLATGVGLLAGSFAILELRVHFLSVLALPIALTVGVQASALVAHRARRDGAGGASRALRHAGGAALLASVAAILGGLALARSARPGVRELGVAAAVGSLSCLLAASLVLPAGLRWIDRGGGRRRPRLLSVRPARLGVAPDPAPAPSESSEDALDQGRSSGSLQQRKPVE